MDPERTSSVATHGTHRANSINVVAIQYDRCNALFNYLIILLDDMVYVYILYGF